jgi:hypothetical protein
MKKQEEGDPVANYALVDFNEPLDTQSADLNIGLEFCAGH